MGLHQDSDLHNEKMFLLRGREGCFVRTISLLFPHTAANEVNDIWRGWESGEKDREGRHAERETGIVRCGSREGSVV